MLIVFYVKDVLRALKIIPLVIFRKLYILTNFKNILFIKNFNKLGSDRKQFLISYKINWIFILVLTKIVLTQASMTKNI